MVVLAKVEGATVVGLGEKGWERVEGVKGGSA